MHLQVVVGHLPSGMPSLVYSPIIIKQYIAIYMIVCIHVVTAQTSVLHVNLQVWCMTCAMVAVVVIRDWLCQVPNESIIIVINKMSSCIYMHLQVVVGHLSSAMPSLVYSPIIKRYIHDCMYTCIVTAQTSVLHVNLQVWCMTCVMVVIRDWLCQVPNESIIITKT